jgi:putative FmdB family regulatory protein
MPTYEYRCNSCGKIQEEIHSIKTNPEIACQNCEEKPMERLISLNISGFITGDTEAKLWKEKRHRKKKNADLDIRQIERYGTGPRLTPNVGGQEVGSWSEAKKLAKDKGKNTSSYDKYIRNEKSTSKISGINDRAYKSAKEKRDKS